MTDVQKALEDFHIAFNHVKNATPTVPSPETKALRLKLLKEEYEELVEAIENDDLAEILHEAVDLVYVAVGVTTSYGLPFNAGFEEIHQANMRKQVPCSRCHNGINLLQVCQTCNGTGKVAIRSAEGKTLKPPGWKPADMGKVIYG